MTRNNNRQRWSGLRPGESLGERVVLSHLPRNANVNAVVEHARDPDVEATRWLPIPSACPRDAARRVVAEFRTGWGGRFGLTFVISDLAGEAFLGVISLARHSNDTGEISYGVAPARRNRGLPTRAAKLLALWSFEELGLRRVETRTGARYPASRRVAEKAGFSCERVDRTRVLATGEEYDDVVHTLRVASTLSSLRETISAKLKQGHDRGEQT